MEVESKQASEMSRRIFIKYCTISGLTAAELILKGDSTNPLKYYDYYGMITPEMNVFELDSRKTELKRPTHEAKLTIAEYGGMDIGVCVADARELDKHGKPAGKVKLWLQSYKARLDEFECQRALTIAEASKDCVIAVEMPGVGISESADAKLTLLQKIDLMRGNFDHIAHSMLGAANEVFDFSTIKELELVLYSQGILLGGYVAEDLGHNAFDIDVKLPKITCIEDVNDGHINYRLASIDAEDTDPETKIKHGITDRYLKENEKYSWLVLPADRTSEGKARVELLDGTQSTVLNLGAMGLVLASFPDVMERAISVDKRTKATGVSESEIKILKMNASVVSALNGANLTDRINGNNESTVRRLNSAMPLGMVTLNLITAPVGQEGHHHPAVHSMPNVNILANEFMK